MIGDTVEDGFGSVWYRCQYPDCDLSVVRPGKVQCSGCDVDNLRACRDMSREALEQIITESVGTPLEQFVRDRYEYIWGGGGHNPFIGWKVEMLERELREEKEKHQSEIRRSEADAAPKEKTQSNSGSIEEG